MTKSLFQAAIVVAMLSVASSASASTLFLGFDTQSPVQTYTTGGAFLGNFGQGGATGSALDGAGSVWTVAPDFGNNVIQQYDAVQTLLNSFVAVVNGQWIEDMAYGGGNTLWVSTFEHNVFNIDATTGTINSSFPVANSSYTGVAFDGTDLWVTGGLTSNNIFRYSTAGVLLQTIPVGFQPGGIGYDLATNTLWVGTVGTVWHLDLAGNALGSFVAGTQYHDGLEIGDIAAIPEPATLVLLGTGLAAAGARRRMKKRG